MFAERNTFCSVRLERPGHQKKQCQRCLIVTREGKDSCFLSSIFTEANTSSSGQTQLMALARISARRPPTLILDEPSSHLDSDGEKLFFEPLPRLKVPEGYTPTISNVTRCLNRSRDGSQLVITSSEPIEAIEIHEKLPSDDQGTS